MIDFGIDFLAILAPFWEPSWDQVGAIFGQNEPSWGHVALFFVVLVVSSDFLATWAPKSDGVPPLALDV